MSTFVEMKKSRKKWENQRNDDGDEHDTNQPKITISICTCYSNCDVDAIYFIWKLNWYSSRIFLIWCLLLFSKYPFELTFSVLCCRGYIRNTVELKCTFRLLSYTFWPWIAQVISSSSGKFFSRNELLHWLNIEWLPAPQIIA